MFCPRCSQQQTSDDLRFCPGCGLQLEYLAALVANNGVPQSRDPEARKNLSRLRRERVRLGAKLMFLGVFLLPVAIVFSVRFDSPMPFILPSLLFLLGLAQVLYVWLFGEHQRSGMAEPQPEGSSAVRPRFNLPVAQTMPFPINGSKRIDTAEIVRPPSVTEHTTRLLDDDH